MNRRDYSQLSVEQVKAAVDAGDLTVDEVRQLEGESRKTPRKSIINFLASIPDPSAGTEDEIPVAGTKDRTVADAPFTVPGIDPKLVEQRERDRIRDQLIRRLQPRPATLDPKLEAIREATRAKEASLRGRSLREPPTGR